MSIKKGLFIAIIFVSLLLGSCGPTIQKTEPIHQNAAVQFDIAQLEKIIAEEKTKLNQTQTGSDEWAIWKDNPSYTGRWNDKDGSEHYGYSETQRPLTMQDFYKLRLAIITQYHPAKFTLEKVKDGLPVGTTIFLQGVLAEASAQHLIPATNGTGYVTGKTHFIILVKKMSDIPEILKATDYLHIPREMLDFQEMELMPI